MMARFLTLSGGFFAVSLLFPGNVQAQDTPSLKAEVLAEVSSPELQKLSQEMVDMLYSFSELGFQEFWTLDYVTGILERGGIYRGAGVRRNADLLCGELGIGEPRGRVHGRHRCLARDFTETGRPLAGTPDSPWPWSR